MTPVSGGQESGSVLAGSLWLRSLRLQVLTAVSEDFDEGWRICFQAHSSGRWQELRFLAMGASFQGCSQVDVPPKQMIQEWGKKSHQGESHNVFYNLISELT